MLYTTHVVFVMCSKITSKCLAMRCSPLTLRISRKSITVDDSSRTEKFWTKNKLVSNNPVTWSSDKREKEGLKLYVYLR